MIKYNINLNKNSNTIRVIILKTQTILKNVSFCAPWTNEGQTGLERQDIKEIIAFLFSQF